jgi:adenylate cyclase
MAATRRLAAILVADVVGYSRLMGVDEEGTLAALKALRHESRVVQQRLFGKILGESFLISFRQLNPMASPRGFEPLLPP